MVVERCIETTRWALRSGQSVLDDYGSVCENGRKHDGQRYLKKSETRPDPEPHTEDTANGVQEQTVP